MQPRRRSQSASSSRDEPSNSSSLITTGEVARLLKVHPKQAYRLMKRGLPAHRVGSEWRFERSEVLAWVRRGARSSASSDDADGLVEGPPPLLGANGDVVVEALLGRVASDGRPIGLVASDSARSLALLGDRRIVAAGFHGEIPPSRLPQGRLARIHLVRREVGLAGKTKSATRIEDVPALRLASRPATAGCRKALDAALRAIGVDPDAVHAKASIRDSHRAVVCAVASGEADVGLTTHAWAHRLGLAFTPLSTEDYGLLLFAEDLGRPEIVGLCDVAQARATRALVESEPGYDAAGIGSVRYDP